MAFTVKGKNIIVDLRKITEEEKEQIKNYREFGYDIIDKHPEEYKDMKKSEKEEKAKDTSKVRYTQEEIVAYVEKYGTDKQKEEFKNAYNLPNKKGNTYEEDTEKHKKGEVIPQGFLGARAYFKKTFKDYPNAPKTTEEE